MSADLPLQEAGREAAAVALADEISVAFKRRDHESPDVCRWHRDVVDLVLDNAEVVPREVAERLARALEENQRLRYSSHAGKVAAQWVAADEALAEFRAVFSKAGDRKIPSNAHEAEEFDARQAGRRVVEKHGDALRRLSDEAEEA